MSQEAEVGEEDDGDWGDDIKRLDWEDAGGVCDNSVRRSAVSDLQQ